MWNSAVRHQQQSGVTFSSIQNNGHNDNGSAKQQQPAKSLGVTSDISWDGPRPEHLQKTEELLKALENYKIFETDEELSHREKVLAKLNALFKQWIKENALAEKMPEAAAERLGGKIYTFGSYRLGVHLKGADIDALCLAPRNINRADFFTSFFKVLKKQPEVTKCRAVEEAFVPVIKLTFDGIEMDLVFARLHLTEIPDNFDLSDDNLLKDLDQRCVRSLNGCRVTDAILSLVPNIENFRLALRSIKLWAKTHGVYSNALGYFGGVTWAILVARVCQLYPNATASTLIHKFFLVFRRWPWPGPVLLRRIDNVNSKFPVWDPRIHIADRYHLMPIITPAYPEQNSTFNVSESTKKVLLMELNQGMSAIDETMLGAASWDRFFEAPNFFYKYRHFLVLLVTSQSADDHLELCGLVESKIRLLICNLERNPHISLAHVNPKCFDNKKSKSDNNSCSQNSAAATTITSRPFISMWFIGLQFIQTKNLNLDLTEYMLKFTETVLRNGANIKMVNKGVNIELRRVKRAQLSQYLDADFLKREYKPKNRTTSSNNAAQTKRNRPSSEMQQEDIGNRKKAKRPRISQSKYDSNIFSIDSFRNTTQPKTAPTINAPAAESEIFWQRLASNSFCCSTATPLYGRRLQDLSRFRNN